MNIEQLKKSGRIIYEFVSGSHAYGLNTKNSDTDIRGLFYFNQKELLSLKPHTPDPISDNKNDTSYYSIGRFFELAKDVNPNIIEFLWSPEDCIRIKSSIVDKIIKNRNLFISKKAKHTFAGYAHAQLEKCRGTNKLVHNPQPEEKPKKEDFCYFINVLSSGDKLEQWEKGYLSLDSFNIPCRPVKFTGDNGVGFDLSKLRVAAVEHIGNLFRLYRNGKGVFRDGQLVCDSIPMDEEWENFIGLMIYHEQVYDKAMKDHKNYWDWIKNRNESRWVSQEKGNLTYDCYLDSETEFLTDNGWKKYSDISWKDKVAGIDSNHKIKFHKPLDRFEKKFSGDIYTYENRYTKFSVTKNHKIYVSDAHRGPKNNYSTSITKDVNWHLETVEDFFNGKRSKKHVLVTLLNTREDYNISDELIQLMGFYISEGSISFGRNGTLSQIFISQIENGKINSTIENFKTINFNKTRCFRDHIKKYEITYRILDKKIVKLFHDSFGHGCRNKKMPSFIYKFSNRQFNLLLDSMMLGDGHRHSKGHSIYYSTSIKLINDLHTLCFMNGIKSQIYDYSKNKHDTSQLFMSKNNSDNVTVLNKNNKYKKNLWKVKKCINEKIVCFEVPNNILITRNSGKIAVQGNSKNVMHCIRLLISAINILRNGEPIVRFSGDQQKFLMDIRNDKFEYDYLMKFADDKMKELDDLYKTSTIPNSVDMDKIDDLYLEILDDVSKLKE